MFIDEQISLSKLSQTVPKLSKMGIASVAHHLQLPAGVVSSLTEKNLLDAVLKEIEKRNASDLCTLRSFNDHPVGIPRGLKAPDLNKAAEQVGGLAGLDAPYTLLSFKKRVSNTFEVFKDDAFALNYSASINSLTSRVEQRAELLRMVCTNRGMICMKEFVRRSTLATFEPSFNIFEEKRKDLIDKVQKILTVAMNKKADVTCLRVSLDIARNLKDDDLKGYVQDRLLSVMNNYEIPRAKKDDGKTFNLFLLPPSWQKTALLEESVYDVWNATTKEITKVEVGKGQTPEILLASHIKAGELIRFKESEVLTAKKRSDVTVSITTVPK